MQVVEGVAHSRWCSPTHTLAAFILSMRFACFPMQVVEGVDILIVRELVGGIYFGEPRVSVARQYS